MASHARRARGIRFSRSRAAACACSIQLRGDVVSPPHSSRSCSPAAPAHAQPTVAEIEAQIDELWAELEPMIEEHNAARIELAEKQEEADKLAEKIAPLQLKVDRAMAEIGDIAVYTYKGGHASAFNALLSTGSPAAFADQLMLLDQFSRVQQEQLESVHRAEAGVRGSRRLRWTRRSRS